MLIQREMAQELVLLSSRLIGEKVLITDTDGIIIGCSDEERIGELHEASLDVLQTRQSSSHDQDTASELQGTFAGITLPLEYDGKLIGTVGITGDPRHVGRYGELIRAFSEMLMRTRENQRLRADRDRESLSLLREILDLDGTAEQEERIILRAEAMGCSLPGHRAAVLVQLDEPSEDMELLREAFYQIFDPATEIAGPLSPHRILTLSICRSEPADIKALRDRCRALYENLRALKMNCVIGIGAPADDLPQLKRSCEDAMQTVRIALKTDPRPAVLSSEEAALERMIASIPSVRYSKNAVSAMEILQRQKDSEEIMQMIVVWCQHAFNVSDTARALFIHKNTLIYRLERVERLTGFDLRSFRDALTLYLMIMSRRYAREG